MNEIKLFENTAFGRVRVIEEDGKVLFCATDIAKGLGYSNPNKSINDHCKGVTKRYTLTAGGRQSLSYIPEGDVYRLITHSKLPDAQRFESWVFDDILPSIRRTGEYKTPEKSMTEYQRKTTEIKSQALALRRARFLSQQADKYDGAASQALRAYAVKEITGDFVIPLPELQRTYSAAEIGWKLGISANVVGRIAKAHNLKTEQYGIWVLDKAKHCDKEVSSFRYFENVIPEIRKAYQEEQKNVSE